MMTINFSIVLVFLATAIGINVSAAVSADVAKTPSQRIIFVAPHPDDELLGMGAMIWSAQRNPDAAYRVVIVTCGDAYKAAFDKWVLLKQASDLNHDGKVDYQDFGIARHDESLRALGLLGVPPENVIFLGYPDGGLDQLASPGAPPYRSPFTNTDHVPYPFAYQFGAPYTAETIVGELKDIILKLDATAVYSTTPTDRHPDHAWTNAYVSQALKLAGGQRSHFEYLIHWEFRMPGWPGTSSQWQDPKGHISPDLNIPLATLKMDLSLKNKAIKLYTTQTNIEMDYLEGFAKNSEIFWNARPLLSDYLLR